MNWRLGTMGFGYPGWSGTFYPKSLKPAGYLAWYAKHFDTVELDTTFYATPPAERIRGWADAVPDSFRFCAKAPRAITHELPLEHATEPMLEFCRAIGELGEKLGVVVLQFPPTLASSDHEALEALLGALPREMRFAVEFRHRSWWTASTREMLERHRCCWVTADFSREPAAIMPTADFHYVRWLGEHGRYTQTKETPVDVSQRLEWWAERLKRSAVESGISTTWGFFNHDYSGFAIGDVRRMRTMVGLSETDTPQDPTLFA